MINQETEKYIISLKDEQIKNLEHRILALESRVRTSEELADWTYELLHKKNCEIDDLRDANKFLTEQNKQWTNTTFDKE